MCLGQSECARAVRAVLLVVVACLFWSSLSLPVNGSELDTNRLTIERYLIKAAKPLVTNLPNPDLSRYTGTNVGVAELVKAATEVQAEFEAAGAPDVSVAIALDLITNGVVTMNVFKALKPQILVSGKRYQAEPQSELATAVTKPVETTQIAPTILKLLGLNPHELEAVRLEGTQPLF